MKTTKIERAVRFSIEYSWSNFFYKLLDQMLSFATRKKYLYKLHIVCVYREVDISLILDRYRYGSFQGRSSTKPSKMHCEFCVTFQKGKHISTPDQESGAWHSSTSGEIIKKVRSGALHEVQTTTPKRVRIESRIKKRERSRIPKKRRAGRK